MLDQATREIVQEQVRLGIDFPTDGELRRENYIHYHCRHLEGIDFSKLTEKVMRLGAWVSAVPTITGRIRAKDHFLPRNWEIALSVFGSFLTSFPTVFQEYPFCTFLSGLRPHSSPELL